MAHFKTVSPVDGRIVAERPWADGPLIERTLERAAVAQRSWRLAPLSERQRACRALVAAMTTNSADCAEQLTLQMGRPIAFAPFELAGFADRAHKMIELAPQALADVVPVEQHALTRHVRRVPLGVVLVLSPWNYPYLTSVNAVIPALLAGNSVVLKHSEQTPLCAERYEAAAGEAGLPPGVLQYLHMDHGAVASVVRDPRVNHVSFTGSVAGGEAVTRAASTRFIGTGLELGGKDPAYVRADADMEFAVEQLADGAFFNSGQSCCGIERIYVQQDFFGDFVDAFVAQTRRLVLGSPLDPATTLGPMVRESAANMVRGQVARAVAAGARALVDESEFARSRLGSPYLAPQVLVDVTHGMDVMREETFGPVVGIMPVRDDRHAVALMNDCRYGLTASLWTADLDLAADLGERLEAGTVFANRCDYLDPELAWTGVKDSGRGCTLSAFGFDQFTRLKSFHLRGR